MEIQNPEVQPARKQGISTVVGIIIIIAVALILFGGVFAYQYFTSRDNKFIGDNPSLLSVQDIIGFWESADKESVYNFLSNDDGTKTFSSYLHHSPMYDGIWSIQDNKLILGEPANQILPVKRQGDILFVQENGTNGFTEYFLNKTVDQTAGWKTYTNSEYGFEFKYPGSWVTDNAPSGPTVSVWSSEQKRQDVKSDIIGNIRPDFVVNYCNSECLKKLYADYGMEANTTLKDFVRARYANYKEIVVGGKKAYEWVSTSSVYDYTIYIESENGIYVLATLSEDYVPEISPIVQNIISTFKFTNPDQTAGWKIYTNSEYGFEIKYPQNFNLIDQSSKDFLNIQMDSTSDYKSRTVQVSLTDGLYIRNLLAAEPSSGFKIFNTTEKIGNINWYKQERVFTPTVNGIYGDIMSYRVGKDNLTYMISCDHCVPPPDGGSEADAGFVDFISTFKFTK